MNAADLFERRWSCGVARSGYHNGCHCTPDDPHDGWGCGFRWLAPALTDAQARELGVTPNQSPKVVPS